MKNLGQRHDRKTEFEQTIPGVLLAPRWGTDGNGSCLSGRLEREAFGAEDVRCGGNCPVCLRTEQICVRVVSALFCDSMLIGNILIPVVIFY